MQQVLFGDIFVNILLRLRSKDLYVLSQVCVAHRKQITKNVLMRGIERDVVRKLRDELGEKYDGFMKMCIERNASIAGPFITQCMCDEGWGNKIIVLIPKRKDIKSCMKYYNDPRFISFAHNYPKQNMSDDEIVEYITNNFTYKKTTRSVSILERFEVMYCFDCLSGNTRIDIQFLYLLSAPISIKKYVLANDMYDTVFKNIYNLRSGLVYIHDMKNIFDRRTKLSETLHQSLIIRDMGFNFYDSDNKILSDTDILAKYYDVMKIKRHALSNIDFPNLYGRTMLLKNNMIYYQQGGLKFHVKLLFNVIEMTSSYKSKQWRFKIDDCLYDTCSVKKMYPDVVHMHGEHHMQKVGSKEIILFLVQ